jgi:hypothetical protein
VPELGQDIIAAAIGAIAAAIFALMVWAGRAH